VRGFLALIGWALLVRGLPCSALFRILSVCMLVLRALLSCSLLICTLLIRTLLIRTLALCATR
jgi:hypothetical protein